MSLARELILVLVMEVRRGLLSIMLRIIVCMILFWRVVNVDEDFSNVLESNIWIMGRFKVCLVDLLIFKFLCKEGGLMMKVFLRIKN